MSETAMWLIVIGSFIVYTIIGATFQGYVNEIGKDDGYPRHWLWAWDNGPPLPFLFWPAFLIAYCFRCLRNPFAFFDKIGQRAAIKELQKQRAHQENLHKLRQELNEAEQEVEQALRNDETIVGHGSQARIK